MSSKRKIFEKILFGQSDHNIRFSELSLLLKSIGFNERIKGSHHIYYKEGVLEILNLQPLGSMAKAYQVKQVRNIILEYKIKVEK